MEKTGQVATEVGVKLFFELWKLKEALSEEMTWELKLNDKEAR